MKRLIAIVLAICVMLCLCGCNRTLNSGKPNIAVTIVPQAEFVRAVAGDLWDVNVIVPAGSSPETFEPTATQRMALQDSVIYFSIGVPAESAAIMPIVGKDTKVVALHEKVALSYPDRQIADGRDPHIWLSPKRVEVMVETIAEELSQIDSANAEIYKANAKTYIDRLRDLDNYIKDKLSSVENRKMIVFHPAFGYLADDYGIEMYALQEEGREATIQHMQNMADFAKREGIKALFYQAEIDSKQADAFAEQIGGKTIMLAPLAENYIENLKGMADLLAETMK